MSVPYFLTGQPLPFETIIHPPAFTAQKRAKYMRMPGAQVAKCVLLAGPRGYWLAVLPATRRIDTDALAAALGGPVRLAELAEIATVFTDCERGLVAPFGTRYGVPTLLDESLAPETTIALEVNQRAETICMRCSDFEQLERPRRLPFSCTRTPHRNGCEPPGLSRRG
jgi:Ala-tRNA(Pro) deacylase